MWYSYRAKKRRCRAPAEPVGKKLPYDCWEVIMQYVRWPTILAWDTAFCSRWFHVKAQREVAKRMERFFGNGPPFRKVCIRKRVKGLILDMPDLRGECQPIYIMTALRFWRNKDECAQSDLLDKCEKCEKCDLELVYSHTLLPDSKKEFAINGHMRDCCYLYFRRMPEESLVHVVRRCVVPYLAEQILEVYSRMNTDLSLSPSYCEHCGHLLAVPSIEDYYDSEIKIDKFARTIHLLDLLEQVLDGLELGIDDIPLPAH